MMTTTNAPASIIVILNDSPCGREEKGMRGGELIDVNQIILIKGKERYVFYYEDHQLAEVQRHFGRFAANPELSFSWYDAAVMSHRVRKTAGSEDLLS